MIDVMVDAMKNDPITNFVKSTNVPRLVGF
jgi:hypothetical protein